MAVGKYSRIDNRKHSSNYCSTVSIVVFVAMCLGGVWMMTSSVIPPPANIPPQEDKNDVKEQLSTSNQFQDNSGDLPEDSTKVGTSTQQESQEYKAEEKLDEIDKPEKVDSDSKFNDESNVVAHNEEQIDEKAESGGDDSDNGSQVSNNNEANKKPDSEVEEENKTDPNEPENKSVSDSIDAKEKSDSGDEEKKSDSGDEEKKSDSGDEEKKSDSDEEEKKSDSDEEEKKSDSYEEEKKSDSVEEEKKLDSGEKEKKSDSGEEDKKSDSGEEEKKSDSDEEEKKSDSDEEEKKSDSDEEEKKPDSDEEEKKPDPGEEEKKSESGEEEKKSESGEEEKKSESGEEEKKAGDEEIKMKSEEEAEERSDETKTETEKSKEEEKNGNSEKKLNDKSELLNETTVASGGSWSTQAAESKNEKEAQLSSTKLLSHPWKLCNSTAGPDYIPCLDNWKAIRNLRSTKHYEHRERHCPSDPPTCLVPSPKGYKVSTKWPISREKIWYRNVPHTKLAELKGHQNWVKVTGTYLTFPGGGTQFKNGALHYIDFINESVREVNWGKHSRVVLDVGCGVASFGGYLFDRDVITMSFAPKDEHEAQVQFALERGIPAISAVMGTVRLPFPSAVFDVVHCARCRVPWHIEGGKLLLELDRVLRPGGFFIWSATPVYQKLTEDIEIWKAMNKLTKGMCWELVSVNKDTFNSVGIALYRKPTSNDCYQSRSNPVPPICESSDDPNAAWNVPLQACIHKVPEDSSQRGSQWPEQWPLRLEKTPYWMSTSKVGVYGKLEPEDFASDHQHWKRVVSKSYLNDLGIDWSNVRNVMDMRAIYGGFAAALKGLNVWVMNVVPIDSPDTLPIIYERGLFGIYHDWCESFSTYPRSYDLLHADHLFSSIKKRCNLIAVVAEVDRILRPRGNLIVRDDTDTIAELEQLAKSLRWEVRLSYSKDKVGLLCLQKSPWRPSSSETIDYAIA